MSCKFQEFHVNEDGKTCTKPMCKCIYGECQFIKEGSEKYCSIYGAYATKATSLSTAD
jgi:hypothetical protein